MACDLCHHFAPGGRSDDTWWNAAAHSLLGFQRGSGGFTRGGMGLVDCGLGLNTGTSEDFCIALHCIDGTMLPDKRARIASCWYFGEHCCLMASCSKLQVPMELAGRESTIKPFESYCSLQAA